MGRRSVRCFDHDLGSVFRQFNQCIDDKGLMRRLFKIAEERAERRGSGRFHHEENSPVIHPYGAFSRI